MDLELLNAARSGDKRTILELANHDVERNIYDEATPEGNTIVHIAARFGHLPLVDEIVKLRPSLILKSNIKGETPVHIAARAGQHYVVQYLIKSVEKFSRIYLARIRDKYGNTPLHGAARNGHDEVVKVLAGYDKESLLLVNDEGESPLSTAIDMRFTEIAKSIISLNASTLQFIGHNGQTALHYTVIRRDTVTMNVVLRLKKDLVRVQDERNRTPLHYAVALGHQTMVEKLLQIDPKVAYMEDDNKQVPVHLAAENGQISLIKTLLNRCPDTIELVDKKRRNILHLAAKNGNLNVVSYVLKLPEMEDLVNSLDEDGNTPLHLATSNYYSDVVNVLSRNPKVEIRAINKFNKTALAMVNLSDDGGMELQKHLTLKALKHAYKQKAINSEDFLENNQLNDVDAEKGTKNGKVEVEKGGKDGGKRSREMAQTISVMSTLIATFTFTAAFTIPGGFQSNDKEPKDMGMAVLISKSAFRAFVITDTVAMTSSITSAVIVFWSLSRRDTESFMDTLPFAIGLTWISLIAMALAFVTGLFVVLQKTLWLAILVCVIGSAAPFFLYVLAPLSLPAYEWFFKSRTSIANRRNIVDDNPFWFIVRLTKMFFSRIFSRFSCMRSCCTCCTRMCCKN